MLPFHSNYGPILYHFPHIARYWSKIAKFIYPTCVQRPRRGWSVRNFAKMLSTGKTRWSYYTLKKLRWYVKPFRYNIGVWQTDGRTGERTDGHNSYINVERIADFCCADAREKCLGGAWPTPKLHPARRGQAYLHISSLTHNFIHQATQLYAKKWRWKT